MVEEFSKLLLALSQLKIEKQDIATAISCLDLTDLNPDSDWAKIFKLCEKANTHSVASICILTQHIKQARPLVDRITTVVNFPKGDEPVKTVSEQINDACQLGADEIDFVLNYKLYLQGGEAKKQALEQVSTHYQQCQQAGVSFKVILETSEFNSIDAIYQVSCDVIEAGCDFLKTSTGTSDIGASLDAGFAMLKAIQAKTDKSIGIKFSGGINSTFQAVQYMELTKRMLNVDILSSKIFRLGASKLLTELVSEINSGD